jgi:uncharacterized protein (DUF427 family)
VSDSDEPTRSLNPAQSLNAKVKAVCQLTTQLDRIMTTATWNGVTLAQSDATVVVDNNQYFPPDSINKQYLLDSNTHTTCGWKGLCSYYSIEVDGQINQDAAWYYPEPKDAAKNIKGYVAFWKGVKVS